MKLAHIVPTSLLDKLPAQQEAFFAISEMVERDSEYANFYRERSREGKHVILDNPVHEDRPVDFEQFFRAAAYIKPTVAILPDVIDDTVRTFENAGATLNELAVHCPGAVPMVVPHGVTHDEFLECAKALVSLRGVGFLGLTLERRLNNDPLAYERRKWRLSLLLRDPWFEDIRIHYLGISEDAREFSTMEIEQIFSADTAKFGVRALTRTDEPPPGPFHTPYPGRKALGGRFGFFGYTPPELVLNPQWLRDYFTPRLGVWCEAAERIW